MELKIEPNSNLQLSIKHLLLLVLLLLIGLSTYSQKQIDPPVSITVDVENSKISDADLLNIPFDEAFYISGTKKDFKGTVIIKYKIAGHCKDATGSELCQKAYRNQHYYIKDQVNKSDGYVEFPPILTSNGSFSLLMPMLHPNENYEIIIDFVNEFSLGDTESTKLKVKLANAIDNTYKYNDNAYSNDNGKAKVDATAIKKLKSVIKSNIEKATNDKTLLKKDNTGKLTNVDFDKILDNGTPLQSARQKISNNNYSIYKTIDDMNSRTNAHKVVPDIISELYKNRTTLIKNIKYVLTRDHLKKFRETPVDLLSNDTIHVETVLKLVLEDFQRDNEWASFNLNTNSNTSTKDIVTFSYLFKMFTGKAKIEENTFKSSSKYDRKSVSLLLSTISLLEAQKYKSGGALFPDKTVLQNIKLELTNWIQQVKKIEGFERKLSAAKLEFPDVLEETYEKWTISSRLPTTVIIDSKESPYLGLDIGYLYAPKIGSSFVFESINFHLVPVNRKGKFSQYKGLDKILKSTSIMLGFAQRIGHYDDNFEAVTGIGSPFGGIGFRLGKIIRINGGYIFYREKNSNPIVSKKTNLGTYFVSASIDVKLKDALGFIVKLIK